MLLETLLCVPWDGMLMHERVKFALDLILITNPSNIKEVSKHTSSETSYMRKIKRFLH